MGKLNIKFVPLAVSIALCFFAAATGSAFTADSIPGWYANLNKPFFNPPNWIFGPVWTILYLLMAFSLYLIWISQNKKRKKPAIKLFLFQLALNVLWSILFFGMKSPMLAFFEIVILWTAILFTIKNFLQISVSAGRLLIPYLLWVTFAALLNFSITLLNP